ncbi:MAG TPA: caspase family protein, partial [Chloroflexia bacterium]|nr:caspase family protein [Chloroflexia bacterium]
MNSIQAKSTASSDIESAVVAVLPGNEAGGETIQRVPFWALLVGIDKYVTQVPLFGCVNDVENMQAFLINRYHVPPAQIRVLKNEQATRQAILDQFQSFLIANPQIRKGDQVLFQYCGHGSQMPSRLKDAEPDGLDETIVPYDSRTAGVYDIPDKTLGALLKELAERKGSNITVIMDSCHSGSGTRGKANIRPGVRLIPTDERIPPPDLDADILSQAQQRVPTRGGTASGWLSRDMPYVLLAGCRESELSQEYLEASVGPGHSWHGAFSYFLLKALNTLPSDTPYKMVMERVANKVAAVCPGQNPQCEGEKERVNSPIFGGVPMRMDPFITVQGILDDGGMVRLNGGRIVGLLSGTRLALYGPDVRTTGELAGKQPLATATIREAGAVTALSLMDGSLKDDVSQMLTVNQG